MDAIEAMVAKGREAIEAREKASEEQRLDDLRQKREDWQKLQEQMRLAFPEAVREFVFVQEAKEEHPDDYPGGRGVEYPAIEIPGFAPIALSAALESSTGKWKQIHNKDRFGHGGLFDVPGPYRDYEYGVLWSRNEGVYTDSLEEALAYAKHFAEKREQMERRDDLDRVAKLDEAQYLPVIEEQNPTLMDQLVELIRDLVREEIARNGA